MRAPSWPTATISTAPTWRPANRSNWP
jgi:hypothetical protein